MRFNMDAVSAVPTHLQRPSEVLHTLATLSEHDIAVEEVVGLLGERAFGAGILVFALPVLLPLPPGSTFIFALPLIFITAQLMWGRHTLWLPDAVGRRRIPLGRIRWALPKAARALGWCERFLKTRHQLFCTARADRLTGTGCLVLSLVLLVPLPLSNLLPAFALTVFALGMVRRDGIVIAYGWMCWIFALTVTHLATAALAHGATPLLRALLG
jgi:hypothetical protein